MGNMGEQPVAECFTLHKYIGKKIWYRIKILNNNEIHVSKYHTNSPINMGFIVKHGVV